VAADDVRRSRVGGALAGGHTLQSIPSAVESGIHLPRHQDEPCGPNDTARVRELIHCRSTKTRRITDRTRRNSHRGDRLHGPRGEQDHHADEHRDVLGKLPPARGGTEWARTQGRAAGRPEDSRGRDRGERLERGAPGFPRSSRGGVAVTRPVAFLERSSPFAAPARAR